MLFCRSLKIGIDISFKRVSKTFFFLINAYFMKEPQLFLGSERFPVKTGVKYLALIFDSKLTWLPHLRSLRLRCAKSLDILRMVSRQAWGADRTVLLRLYRALIRSKIAPA